MSRLFPVLLIPSLFLAASSTCFPASPNTLERGRYLVVEIGKCGDCHTQRLESGAPDSKKWLKGAVLDLKPLAPIPGWAGASPDLTSAGDLWKNWGEKALVQFFVTGRGPDGKPPAPPMPAYTLTEEDGRAIVAYLKSLK